LNANDAINCDLYIPNYIIPLSLVDEMSWYSWASKRDLKGLTYAIYYKNTIIKIGCSFSKFNTRKNTNFCDRLIRQLNNLPGRKKPVDDSNVYIDNYGYVPVSPNGEDIIDIIHDFQDMIGKTITREEMYLHIWDITSLKSDQYFWAEDDKGNKQRALYFEGLLIDQYKRDNSGELPIGNRKQDPSVTNSAYVKPQIAKEAGSLFSFAK
jgi:hypothetical protein